MQYFGDDVPVRVEEQVTGSIIWKVRSKLKTRLELSVLQIVVWKRQGGITI